MQISKVCLSYQNANKFQWKILTDKNPITNRQFRQLDKDNEKTFAG